MSDRPTLYLTNLPSRDQHGPGRLVCCMARPPHYGREHPHARNLAPRGRWLTRLRSGEWTIHDYRAAYEGMLEADSPGGVLAPHMLMAKLPGGNVTELRHGDTLYCLCPRPDSPKRPEKARRWGIAPEEFQCHLEWLAPVLVRSGFRVILYGEEAYHA